MLPITVSDDLSSEFPIPLSRCGAKSDAEKIADTSWCSKEICNIILLGLGFMFSIGSFFTCMFSQTVVLNSVHDEYFQGTSTMGYVCLAINFSAMTVSFILAPAVVCEKRFPIQCRILSVSLQSVLIGPKTAMVVGAGFLTLSIAPFLRPLEITLYFGALSQGIGSGLMWTVYGHFLTANSTQKTIGRNTGVFWVLFQSGPVCGNLFYFFLTRGASSITPSIRYTLFSALLPISALGIVILAMLRHPWVHDSNSIVIKNGADENLDTDKAISPSEALRGELKMALSREMILLSAMFVYMGIELTFWMNVYGTSLGYTLQFGEIRESLVGLNGMIIGAGQIAGGFFYGLIGHCLRRNGRDLGILLAFVVHCSAFYIIYLILPDRASLEMTDDPSFIFPNPYLALTGSFLLGFGDAGWNNPLFALFGLLYPNDPVSAFAIFQAYQSLGNVISFAYSTILTLQWQLLIMIIVAVVGLFGYCLVEWKVATDEAVAADQKRRMAEASYMNDTRPWNRRELRIIEAVRSIS